MAKKKILYVITKSNWGGAQRYVFDLAQNLPKDRYEVMVAAGGDGPLFSRLQEAGIRTISIPFLGRNINPVKELISLISFLKIFWQEKPDIVHLNSSKVGGLGAFAGRLAGIPLIIFTAHGWPFAEDRSLLARVVIWFLSWCTAFFSHVVIVLSKKDFWMAQKFPLAAKDKFIFIPNGINEPSIGFLSQSEARRALKISLPPSLVLVGSLTEFTHNKGVRFLVAALPELPKKVNLALMGDGEEKKDLMRLAEKLGVEDRVHFLGYRIDGARYLKAFDIFAFPSLKEGLPYAILEAALATLPIVATAIGGIPDILAHEKQALLVPPKDPRALAEAIKKLIQSDELCARISRSAHAHVHDAFSFDHMRDRTFEIYASRIL
ncbi:MAG: glycosyltransferase family 4 protein [bacterium]|nr:glycosyltransferase family 4 protein [bacterium]